MLNIVWFVFLAIFCELLACLSRYALFLLGSVSGVEVPTPKSNYPDKIIRIKEVLEMSGLSRTTLWRMERKDEFPKRLPLSAGSVGW